MSFQGEDNLVNGKSLFLVVLNKILIFRVNSGDDMLLISEFFEKENLFLSSCDIENLFAFGFRDKFQCSVGLFIGDEDFSILRFDRLDLDWILFDSIVNVFGLFELWGKV
jgi:hypothetical protein